MRDKFNQKQRFSIRKMTLGISSVMVSSLLYTGVNNHAEANEIGSNQMAENNEEVNRTNKNEAVKPQNDSQYSMAIDKNVIEKDNEIPYKTKTRKNKDLPQGARRIKQKGIKGVEHVVITQLILNGKPYGKPTIEKTIAKEKQDEIIEVGTGIKGMTKDVSDRKIYFDTITRINKNLSKGERRIKQKGQDGLERTTTTQDTLNGKPLGQPSVVTKTIKKPVNKIIEVGTDTMSEDVKNEDIEIDYQTSKRYKPHVHKGVENVIQVGEKGIDRKITRQPMLNNKPHGKPTVEIVHVRDKVDEIIEIGTKED